MAIDAATRDRIVGESGVSPERVRIIPGYLSPRKKPKAGDLWVNLYGNSESGARIGLIEVSSQAVVHQRVADVSFHGALLSNLGREYEEFHPAFRDYLEAKAPLFRDHPKGGYIVSVTETLELALQRAIERVRPGQKILMLCERMKEKPQELMLALLEARKPRWYDRSNWAVQDPEIQVCHALMKKVEETPVRKA